MRLQTLYFRFRTTEFPTAALGSRVKEQNRRRLLRNGANQSEQKIWHDSRCSFAPTSDAWEKAMGRGERRWRASWRHDCRVRAGLLDNLAPCQPTGVANVTIKQPSASRDPENIAALTAGLTRPRDPANGDWLSSPIPASRTNVCTEPIGLRVPIRGIAGRRGDTLKLRTVSRSLPGVAGTVVDVDRIDLLCLPAD